MQNEKILSGSHRTYMFMVVSTATAKSSLEV